MVQVAVILTRHLFPPRELIIRSATMPREVYIVNKGIAAGNNQLFTVRSGMVLVGCVCAVPQGELVALCNAKLVI
jgi:hypothetical protein